MAIDVRQRPSRSRPRTGPDRQADLFQCLIASTSPARQRALARGAEQSGWKTVVCGDTPSAASALRRMFLTMAIVDLEGPQNDGFRSLVEMLAGERNLMLVVCGHDRDASEEIWARSLGAWLYLPAWREKQCIAALCGDARTIAERLQGGSAVQRIA